MIYFLACGLVVVLGILGYWVLPHIDFVQHWALKEGKGMLLYHCSSFLLPDAILANIAKTSCLQLLSALQICQCFCWYKV